jgi:hypothetical protein
LTPLQQNRFFEHFSGKPQRGVLLVVFKKVKNSGFVVNANIGLKKAEIDFQK